MNLYWLAAAAAVLVLAYYLGKRKGGKETNREAAGPGTWIELQTDVHTYRPASDQSEVLYEGTQAVITGIDSQDRYSIWVAEPWTTLLDGHPAVHNLEDYGAFRIRAPWYVDEDTHADTMHALAKWTLEREKIFQDLFPPGWVEFQRMLNRGY